MSWRCTTSTRAAPASASSAAHSNALWRPPTISTRRPRSPAKSTVRTVCDHCSGASRSSTDAGSTANERDARARRRPGRRRRTDPSSRRAAKPSSSSTRVFTRCRRGSIPSGGEPVGVGDERLDRDRVDVGSAPRRRRRTCARPRRRDASRAPTAAASRPACARARSPSARRARRSRSPAAGPRPPSPARTGPAPMTSSSIRARVSWPPVTESASPVLVAGARTPIGRFRGALADRSGVELGAAAVARRARPRPRARARLRRARQRPAGRRRPEPRPPRGARGRRHARGARASPSTTSAWRASARSALAASMLREGEATCVLVGGFDSMTGAPHAVHVRGAAAHGRPADDRRDGPRRPLLLDPGRRDGRALGRRERAPRHLARGAGRVRRAVARPRRGRDRRRAGSPRRSRRSTASA